MFNNKADGHALTSALEFLFVADRKLDNTNIKNFFRLAKAVHRECSPENELLLNLINILPWQKKIIMSFLEVIAGL